MLAEGPRPTNLPGVREPEYLRIQRLENLARERQNAFQSKKAQEYWNLDPEELTSRWQKIVEDTIKNISGGDTDVPIVVPPCSFSKEELSGFRNEDISLFVPKRQGKDWVANLGQLSTELNPEKAINGYSLKDTGPSGIWVAMKATIDPPYPGKDKPGILGVIEANNFKMVEGKRKENLEVLKLIGVGIEVYVWFAKLVKEITGFTIDSVDEQCSRLLDCKVGGPQEATVRLLDGKGMEIRVGLPDNCAHPKVGWRLARVSRDLTKG